MKPIRILTIITLCGLTACAGLSKPSYVQKREGEYLTAKSIPPLVIPPGINSSAFHTAYVVPHAANPAQAAVSIVPPGLSD